MSHVCQRLVEAARYLETQGMTVEQLRTLHHSLRRLETFNSTYKYFGKDRELRPVNISYADRLIFVAEMHQAKPGPIGKLVSEALLRWPMSTRSNPSVKPKVGAD